MALFLLKTGTCDTKNCWEFFVDNRIFLEKLITVSSRLNAPVVLWRLNNNYWTLPSRIGLKLLTWQLESVAGLLSTLVTWAVYCPCIGKCAFFIRTSVPGGIVSMSQMTRNLSPWGAEPVKRGLSTFSSLYCHLANDTVAPKKASDSA